MDDAGNIIDKAINSKVTKVNGVEFDLKSETKKSIKDSLIASAIKDAKEKAKLALTPLGYEIKAVKSISL